MGCSIRSSTHGWLPSPKPVPKRFCKPKPSRQIVDPKSAYNRQTYLLDSGMSPQQVKAIAASGDLHKVFRAKYAEDVAMLRQVGFTDLDIDNAAALANVYSEADRHLFFDEDEKPGYENNDLTQKVLDKVLDTAKKTIADKNFRIAASVIAGITAIGYASQAEAYEPPETMIVTRDYINWNPSDLNDDGTIDQVDLALLASDWLGPSPDQEYRPGADIDCDGIVNLEDYQILAGQFANSFFDPEHLPRISTRATMIESLPANPEHPYRKVEFMIRNESPPAPSLEIDKVDMHVGINDGINGAYNPEYWSYDALTDLDRIVFTTEHPHARIRGQEAKYFSVTVHGPLDESEIIYDSLQADSHFFEPTNILQVPFPVKKAQ